MQFQQFEYSHNIQFDQLCFNVLISTLINKNSKFTTGARPSTSFIVSSIFRGEISFILHINTRVLLSRLIHQHYQQAEKIQIKTVIDSRMETQTTMI